VNRAENLQLFGPSGAGKTHLAAGICRSLITLDHSARFFSGTTLLQEVQRAKADYALTKSLNKLDRYALLVIDDIGYVRKDEAETSVLFELVMHRYVDEFGRRPYAGRYWSPRTSRSASGRTSSPPVP
jgi:DNA replication protein DnaC